MDESLLLVLCEYVSWFFLYSFLGWLFEVVYTLIVRGSFANRGFFYGPICPIYGFGALGAILLVSRISNPFVAFVVGALGAGVMEYATSWALEKIFHARWWDYSDFKLNINGRVCLAGLLAFGSMMLILNYLVHPLVRRLTESLPEFVIMALAGALLVVFLADVVVSVVHMHGFEERLSMLQTRIASIADSLSTSIAGGVSGVKDGASDAATGARERLSSTADSARERLSATVEGVRDALRVRGQLEDAPACRSNLHQKRRIASEGWSKVSSARSASELADALRGAMSRFSRTNYGKLRDPEFWPTNAREAWELIKSFSPGATESRASGTGSEARKSSSRGEKGEGRQGEPESSTGKGERPME